MAFWIDLPWYHEAIDRIEEYGIWYTIINYSPKRVIKIKAEDSEAFADALGDLIGTKVVAWPN